MSRPRIAVVFGGRSPEHWISVKSGLFVLLHLDRTVYDVDAVYVRPDGAMADAAGYRALLEQFFAENNVVLVRDPAALAPGRALLDAAATDQAARFYSAAASGTWDLLFPTFHGRFGEDGTFQGLARTLGVRFAGCNFVGSTLGMDKILTKQIAARAGLAVAPYQELHRDRWAAEDRSVGTRALVETLGWPLFVKPARLGSSIGVGRAVDIASLHRALDEAFSYDYRILVESEIRGIEYAVGVVGDARSTSTSVVAEYTSQPENFDYDSKYGPQSLPDIIPARLDAASTERMRSFAQSAFRALKMEGLCRVDSFWGPQGPVLNEVNTLPGLNPNSPFIQAWAAAGVPERVLLGRIVELGLGRAWDPSQS